jgi:hypothetical protein
LFLAIQGRKKLKTYLIQMVCSRENKVAPFERLPRREPPPPARAIERFLLGVFLKGCKTEQKDGLFTGPICFYSPVTIHNPYERGCIKILISFFGC